MRVLTAFAAFSFLSLLALPARAEEARFNDGLIQEVWSLGELSDTIDSELRAVDIRKAEVVAAYNELGSKLNVYNGWCNTYGISALRQVVEGRLYGKIFSWMAYPFYHVYSNDPYFTGARGRVDEAFNLLRNSSLDVGKCALTSEMVARLASDPKFFDPAQNEFDGPSFPYAILAGNIRLLEEERSVLTELKGVIGGSGGNSKPVEAFVSASYRRLQEQVNMLRARTLQGYEMSFRIPLGPLEVYKGKKIGHAEADRIPNFFFIFERRTFYVNQARLAAGKLFDVSVRHFNAVEQVQDRFLKIIQEANQPR
jgi:hypothetical protein